MSRGYAFAAAIILLAGCAQRAERAAVPQPESARARAALATVRVHNSTDESLTVLYRTGGRAATEIAVGIVAARSSAELAPVPAGEPIILIARTGHGAQLSLPARSFAIDGTWTWQIPADAHFSRPVPGSGSQ